MARLWKEVLAGILLVTAVSAVTIVESPVAGDYMVQNEYWNGLSRLVEELSGKGIRVVQLSTPLYALEPSSRVTVIMVGPGETVSGAEVSWLNTLVFRGGKVVVLDDFGRGNVVLRMLGLPVEFVGSPLLDSVLYFKQPIFPVAASTGSLEGFPLDRILVLNVPTALRVGVAGRWNLTVVAESSEFSFLDLNFNGVCDPGEPRGPFPVAVMARRQGYAGYVLVVSDPSMLINCMVGEGDNLQLILTVVGEKGVVVVDVYHRASLPLERASAAIRGLGAALVSIARDPVGAYALITLLSAVISVAAYRRG